MKPYLVQKAEEAAKESTFAAIRASRRKWATYLMLSWDVIEQLEEGKSIDISSKWCALCHRFLRKDGECPMLGWKCDRARCHPLYFEARCEVNLGRNLISRHNIRALYDYLMDLEIKELRKKG
jgi:hypothetical protein